MIILAILFTVLGFLFFPSNIYAEFTFAIPQTTITSDQEIDTTIALSLQGQNNKTYYLEGAFKKEESSNYFGLTWNNSSWIKYTASNFTTLKSITTDQTGKWNGTVKVKLDKTSSLYDGDGIYTLRMKRFTTGGNDFWADNSITLTVNSLPPPTPTHTPTPIPSPTSVSTPTSQPASSFIISNVPSQINSDQSFNVSVDLTLPNNKNADYYLSGAFKKTDGTRYFGLTKINSEWIKYDSSNFLNQYKITTNGSGNWTGTLEVKPDISDTDYKGSGDYIFKVARYTSSGSGPTWSNESTIKIISTESDNLDNSSATSNNSSSTTNPPTPPPSVKATITVSSQPKSYNRLVYRIATVAGATASATIPATATAQVSVKDQKQTNPMVWIGLIFIFAGVGSIGYIYLKKNAKIHI